MFSQPVVEIVRITPMTKLVVDETHSPDYSQQLSGAAPLHCNHATHMLREQNIRLTQLICELLIKNQQLRCSLARIESGRDSDTELKTTQSAA